MLWRKTRKKSSLKNKPYGVGMGWFPGFEGGVGTSCYITITKWLGGQWERVNSTDSSDTYVITFPVKKQRKTA
jgi:hypothetical protein